MISLVTASEVETAQAWNRCDRDVAAEL